MYRAKYDLIYSYDVHAQKKNRIGNVGRNAFEK